MTQESESLFITCPVCGEELELDAEDVGELAVDDVIVCDSCGAEIGVTSVDPPEFELLGLLTECPNCNTEVELDPDELEDGDRVQCPNCGATFTVELEDVEDDRPQA
jgi:lysine biosynthesis protein LysW